MGRLRHHCINASNGLLIGGLMETFQEVSYWPVACADCRAITSANTREIPLVCSECGSSNVIELQDARTYAGDSGWTILQDFDRKLPDGHYKCPNCEKFELELSGPLAFFD
jgi:hypothetical protein